jgi:hypothetical protein
MSLVAMMKRSPFVMSNFSKTMANRLGSLWSEAHQSVNSNVISFKKYLSG